MWKIPCSFANNGEKRNNAEKREYSFLTLYNVYEVIAMYVFGFHTGHHIAMLITPCRDVDVIYYSYVIIV